MKLIYIFMMMPFEITVLALCFYDSEEKDIGISLYSAIFWTIICNLFALGLYGLIKG